MFNPPSAQVVPRPRSNRLCSRHEDDGTDSRTATGLAMVEKESKVRKKERRQESGSGHSETLGAGGGFGGGSATLNAGAIPWKAYFDMPIPRVAGRGISRLMEASVWLPC